MINQLKKVPNLRFKEFEGDWTKLKINELGDFLGGGTPITSNEEFWKGTIPWVSSSDLVEDEIKTININKYITEEAINSSATKIIPKDSILIVSRVGIGKFAVSKTEICTSQDFTNLTLNKSKFNIDFTAYNLYKSRYIFKKIAQGTSIKGFTSVDLRKTKLNFPSLPEQKKIAEFLSRADKRISLLKSKKEQLEEYKKGVMQKIFSREIRFKKDDGGEFPEWQKIKLGAVLVEVNNKSKIPDEHRVISSTAKGLFYQDEYFKREVASKDNTGYKILEIGQLVFSPQNLWLGNLNVNTEFEIGIVSPSYKVFRFKPSLGIVSFFKYFLRTHRMLYEYSLCSEQGASVVRRNLDMSAFKNIIIKLPSAPEQEKIASFLTAIDKRIALVDEQISQAEEWKRGLLQRMFV